MGRKLIRKCFEESIAARWQRHISMTQPSYGMHKKGVSFVPNKHSSINTSQYEV
jgi:hypothetical protein